MPFGSLPHLHPYWSFYTPLRIEHVLAMSVEKKYLSAPENTPLEAMVGPGGVVDLVGGGPLEAAGRMAKISCS
jgi:hypothetical protein